ncbi:hypothetical protein RIF29_09933 [Crotalaria pallida]|uniref:Uncharacterized protein n=1 Tax=Crotalaria pallida TaxID=3830 RepID=A0AAN9ILP5_CROPI
MNRVLRGVLSSCPGSGLPIPPLHLVAAQLLDPPHIGSTSSCNCYIATSISVSGGAVTYHQKPKAMKHVIAKLMMMVMVIVLSWVGPAYSSSSLNGGAVAGSTSSCCSTSSAGSTSSCNYYIATSISIGRGAVTYHQRPKAMKHAIAKLMMMVMVIYLGRMVSSLPSP